MRNKCSNATRVFIALIPALVILPFVFTVNSAGSFTKTTKSLRTPTPAEAAEVYAKNCAKCHGADGRAQTAKGKQTNATDFTNAKWQNSISDAKGIKVITNGHELMPAFKETLSADEIRSVMAFIRNFKK